jgi:hypothetical protein
MHNYFHTLQNTTSLSIGSSRRTGPGYNDWLGVAFWPFFQYRVTDYAANPRSG